MLSRFRTLISSHWHLLLVGVLAAVMLIGFIDIAWWPQDEGVFVHMAERVMGGEVYGVDVYDFHGGYHTYLNTLMFQWFGVDIVVLRYPLILLGIIQAVMISYMLRNVSRGIAIAGGAASLVFGFLQFPNPSPNWYALFFAVSVIFLLAELKQNKTTLLGVGLLLGLCFMFRHPSAVFLSMGVITYLIYTSKSELDTIKPQWLSRGVLLAVAVGILLYSQLVFEWGAFVLFAVPPLLTLFLVLRGNKFVLADWLTKCIWILIGAVAVIMPMVVYQLWHGDLASWVTTAFFSGTSIVDKTFFSEWTYFKVFSLYVTQPFSQGSIAITIVQAGNWLILFATPLIALFLVVSQWQKNPARTIHPAVIIAPFFGLVSFYFQIPFYFVISYIIFVLSIAVQIPRNRTTLDATLAVMIFITVFGSVSVVPGFLTLMDPERHQKFDHERASLRVSGEQQETYLATLSVIETYTTEDDQIYVFPFDPELYFLSKRKNPFPFIGSSFAVNTDETYQAFLQQLVSASPQLVIYNQSNSYKNEYDDKLWGWLEAEGYYELVEVVEDYHFYRWRDDGLVGR